MISRAKEDIRGKTGRMRARAILKVLQRGSSSVYFPVTASSLVIPPFSDIINSRVEDSALYEEFRNTIKAAMDMKNSMNLPEEQTSVFIQNKIDEYAEKIADNIGCRREQVREILGRRMSSGEVINYDTGSIEYRAAEFDAHFRASLRHGNGLR